MTLERMYLTMAPWSTRRPGLEAPDNLAPAPGRLSRWAAQAAFLWQSLPGGDSICHVVQATGLDPTLARSQGPASTQRSQHEPRLLV